MGPAYRNGLERAGWLARWVAGWPAAGWLAGRLLAGWLAGWQKTVVRLREGSKVFKNLVFLRVRMTDCDAGALGNPRNLGGDARAYLTAYLHS